VRPLTKETVQKEVFPLTTLEFPTMKRQAKNNFGQVRFIMVPKYVCDTADYKNVIQSLLNFWLVFRLSSYRGVSTR
jgi:hypothetical protein